jgi:hypothetical protein
MSDHIAVSRVNALLGASRSSIVFFQDAENRLKELYDSCHDNHVLNFACQIIQNSLHIMSSHTSLPFSYHLITPLRFKTLNDYLWQQFGRSNNLITPIPGHFFRGYHSRLRSIHVFTLCDMEVIWERAARYSQPARRQPEYRTLVGPDSDYDSDSDNWYVPINQLYDRMFSRSDEGIFFD